MHGEPWAVHGLACTVVLGPVVLHLCALALNPDSRTFLTAGGQEKSGSATSSETQPRSAAAVARSTPPLASARLVSLLCPALSSGKMRVKTSHEHLLAMCRCPVVAAAAAAAALRWTSWRFPLFPAQSMCPVYICGVTHPKVGVCSLHVLLLLAGGYAGGRQDRAPQRSCWLGGRPHHETAGRGGKGDISDRGLPWLSLALLASTPLAASAADGIHIRICRRPKRRRSVSKRRPRRRPCGTWAPQPCRSCRETLKPPWHFQHCQLRLKRHLCSPCQQPQQPLQPRERRHLAPTSALARQASGAQDTDEPTAERRSQQQQQQQQLLQRPPLCPGPVVPGNVLDAESTAAAVAAVLGAAAPPQMCAGHP